MTGSEKEFCALCYLATVNSKERKSREMDDEDFCFDIGSTREGSTLMMDTDNSFSAISTRQVCGNF